MKRSLYIICVALGLMFTSAFTCRAATPAATVIARCAAKVNESPSMTFRLTMGDTHPTLIVSKDKYRLSSQQMEVWYDGNTMWVYDPASRELTISNPTSDELVECNPMALLNGYAAGYVARNAASGNNIVELVARSKTSTLRKASVTVDPATSLPKRIEATIGSQKPLIITIDSAITGKTLPASTFKYDPKAYPASETTDLR